MTIEKFELEPGRYVLGRSPRCDIHISRGDISRKHGVLFTEQSNWFYQPFLESGELGSKQRVTDHLPIELGHDLDLVPEDFFDLEETSIEKIKDRYWHLNLRKQKIFIGGLTLALVVVTILLITSLFRQLEKPMDTQTLFKEARPKVVELIADVDPLVKEQYKKYGKFEESDFRQTSGFCSGFIVAPDIVLTANHCLQGNEINEISTQFKIRTHDGVTHRAVRVLGYADKLDYLFLEVPSLSKYGFLEFSDNVVQGQKVYTVGNVHGEGIAIRDGLVASRTKDIDEEDISFVRYSAAASPGNSGGPLLDNFGRVVALVFAATDTENYNLGTPSAVLRRALRDYGLNREKKIIHYRLGNLNGFSPKKLLQDLNIPFISNFDEHPDVLRGFENITLSLEVPYKVQNFTQSFLSQLNTEVLKEYKSVLEILKKDSLVTGEWSSYAQEKTPVIEISQFDSSQTSFKKLDIGVIAPSEFSYIETPSQRAYSNFLKAFDENHIFDFQAVGYGMPIWNKMRGGHVNGDVYYILNPTDTKQRLSSFIGGKPFAMARVMLLPDDGINETAIDPKVFLKAFVSDKGLIANSFGDILKPKAEREFTINTLDEKLTSSKVIDLEGRNWTRYSFSLFEKMSGDINCLPLPRGSFCLLKFFETLDPQKLSILRDNYTEFYLSRYMLNPMFWDIEGFKNATEDEELKLDPTLKGFRLDQKPGGAATLTLLDFGLRFRLDGEIISIRPSSGLLNSGKDVRWVGYGYEALRRRPPNNWEICGAGLEIEGTASNAMLNFIRERQRSHQTEGRSVRIPKIWQIGEQTTKTGHQATIYGYCVPLEGSEKSLNLKAKLEKAQPDILNFEWVGF